jgi:hypothetical protein
MSVCTSPSMTGPATGAAGAWPQKAVNTALAKSALI